MRSHKKDEHEINLDSLEKLPKERIKVPRKKRPDVARKETGGNIELARVTDPSVILTDEEVSKVYTRFAEKGLDGHGGNDVTIKTVDWGDFDIEKIVELLVMLGEKLSDKTLFHYQKVHARRIFRSVLRLEGARLSTLFSRQSGKSETTAIAVVTLCVAMPALAHQFPDQLGMFRHGFKAGVFAPTTDQAKLIYDKILLTSKSEGAKAVYEDPDIGTDLERHGCKWSNGSFVVKRTADPKANIEGLSLDLIVLDECVADNTRVMTPSGERMISDLRSGDIVFSMDEETSQVETDRVKVVCDKGRREVIRLDFDDGTYLEGTANHPLFVPGEGWVEISLLECGDEIIALAGGSRQSSIKRVVTKTPIGTKRVFDLTIEKNHNFFANNTLVHNCQDIDDWVINKSILPMGAWNNATVVTIGTTNDKPSYFYNLIQANRMADMNRSPEDRHHAEFDYQTVVKYNPRYAAFVEQEKATNGIQSRHFQMNFCLRWLFEEGSAISDSALKEHCMKKFTGLTTYTIKEPVVVGIDVGSEINSTVVTVGKITKNAEIEFDDVVEKKSIVQVCDWYELEGIDYPTQRALIRSFLERYKNIVWVTVDETGVGKSALQEMKKEWRGIRNIEGFVFNPKSKSYLRSLFEEYLYSYRIVVPSTPEARVTEKWQRWYLQMVNLQKVTRQNYVVFEKKQTIASARDDYPDSFFLMLHAASQAMRTSSVAEVTSFEELVGAKPRCMFEEIREKARRGEYGVKNNIRASRVRKLLKGVI